MTRKIIFDNKKIDDSTACYVIAEVGNNHQGDVENAKKLIKEAKRSGVSAVKFQKRDNKELFTKDMYDSPYVGLQSFASTYGKHRDKLELSENDFDELFKFSKDTEITFFATPFDIKSADFLNELGITVFKIASGDLSNIPLISHVARFGKPMIISTGASELTEVINTFEQISKINPQIILMQCTSVYPAKPITINLRVISTYREKFPDTVIGYSGHDSGTSIPIAAYALGARFIEKHFTLDRGQKGTDHQFSLTPNLLKNLVEELKEVRLSLGDGIKRILSEEKFAKYKMGKKIIAKHEINKGTYISENDILFKSPGDGIPPNQLDKVLGKKTKINYKPEQTIELKDLEN